MVYINTTTRSIKIRVSWYKHWSLEFDHDVVTRRRTKQKETMGRDIKKILDTNKILQKQEKSTKNKK